MKLAEDILRDLAGAACDLSAEAACLLFHNEFGRLGVLLNSQLLKSQVMAVAEILHYLCLARRLEHLLTVAGSHCIH